MGDIDRRQYTPGAINLGVVPVDLGNNKKHAAQENGDSEATNERVGFHVQLEKAPSIEHGAKDLSRKGVELWQERRDGL